MDDKNPKILKEGNSSLSGLYFENIRKFRADLRILLEVHIPQISKMNYFEYLKISNVVEKFITSLLSLSLKLVYECETCGKQIIKSVKENEKVLVDSMMCTCGNMKISVRVVLA